MHVTLRAALHSICLHEGANVILRPTPAAWPNQMDAEAVIPWSNLAELLTQHLVSQVSGTVSSPRVSAMTRRGSLTDGDPLSENHVFGNGVVLLVVTVSGTFILALVARTRNT